MYKPKPKKLGHLVLMVTNLEQSVTFYREVVGLELSDRVGERMAFMHASADHHDLALVQMSEDDMEARKSGYRNIEHFAYQLEDFAEIEAATNMLQQRGIAISRGPGKHGSGENCFIVFQDPDGNNIEFYSDMLQITDDSPYKAKVWADDIDTFDQWRCEKFVVPPPPGIQKKLDAVKSKQQ